MKNVQSSFMGMGCGLQILFLMIYVTIGAWASNTILAWFGKDIPVVGDVIIGFFLGEVGVPIAIVGSVLKFFGVF